MSIPKSTVEHVAKLARLELQEDELERYSSELSNILTLVEELNQLDLSQVEVGMTLDNPTVYREDVLCSEQNREALLQNAPDQEDGFFRVPKILEEA